MKYFIVFAVLISLGSGLYFLGREQRRLCVVSVSMVHPKPYSVPSLIEIDTHSLESKFRSITEDKLIKTKSGEISLFLPKKEESLHRYSYNDVFVADDVLTKKNYYVNRGSLFWLDKYLPKSRWRSFVKAIEDIGILRQAECENISNQEMASLVNYTSVLITEVIRGDAAVSEMYIDSQLENLIVVHRIDSVRSQNLTQKSEGHYIGALKAKRGEKVLYLVTAVPLTEKEKA